MKWPVCPDGGGVRRPFLEAQDASRLTLPRGIVFILEGAPSVLFGILIFFVLPDYPESAKFLTPEEKELAILRMEFNGSKGDASHMTWEDAKGVLLDWRLYLHYIVYFSKSCPFSSLSLFTPSLTKGLGYDSFRAQLMSVPPCT